MKASNQCPKCASHNIIAGAKAIDCSGEWGTIERDLSLATFLNPKALLFKGKQKTALSACVCTDCGYVEFYASDPAALKTEKP